MRETCMGHAGRKRRNPESRRAEALKNSEGGFRAETSAVSRATGASDPEPAISCADIYDTFHAALGVCSLQFRNLGKRETFFGPAETVATFEDHTPVLKCVSAAGNGRVLVVDGRGSLTTGVMGDRLAEMARMNGWAGVVINGAVRDSAAIDAMAFGVKALGATARRGWQATSGRFGGQLRFGDITIDRGDWIYADRDAVLVSKSELDMTLVKGAAVAE
ncbi:ribonuclease E activity regulator RraA [Martelella sp. FLE1502]